jgi:putative transcriptional regulator
MKKNDPIAESILRGARQALAFAKGEADVSQYRVHIPHEIDVRRIRTKLKMTQEVFARQFGFSVNTLRHWEQGKRIPEGPTRAYLLVIDRAPKAVTKALRAA